MHSKLDLILSLSSLHTKIFKQIDRDLSVHGISFSEFYVMHQLSKAPDRTMRRIDLAERVGMSASGITRALNPMEKLKLVQKEKNARDARVSLIKLSDIGFQVFNDALTTVKMSSDNLFEPLNDESIDAFLMMVKTILYGKTK